MNPPTRPRRTRLAIRPSGRAVAPVAGGDTGSASLWLLLVIPAVLVAAGLVVDGGRALTARQQATGLAEQAARAAVDRMDTGGYRTGVGGAVAVAPGSVQAAACSWVAAARPDAACHAQPGHGGVVEVTVTIGYRPVLLGAVTGPVTATGRGTARPAVGVDEEVSA